MSDNTSPEQPVLAGWSQALQGDPVAQGRWRLTEGGQWQWAADGLHVTGNGSQWAGYEWSSFDQAVLGGLTNFAIEVALTGEAEAAGLSFGPYKDFLAPRRSRR